GPTAGSSAAVLARASRPVSRGVGATVEENVPRLARIGAALVAVAALAAALATPSFAAAAPAASPSPLAARRIVSLAPSVTEILFAVGAGDRVVAVSSSCDRPAEVARLPRVGTWVAPSVEEILALSPDLVVAVPSPGNRDAVLRLRELGLRVEVVGEATLGDAWDAMLRIGEWTGRDAEARELVERLRHELDEVRASVAGRRPRRALFVVGHEPLVVAGRGPFVDEILRVAGGENVAATTGRPWPRLSIESVVGMSPEVIVDAAMGSEASEALPSWWSKWESVAAVHDRRVRSPASDAMLRPGPRLGEAAREMRALLWDPAPSPSAR
ncbi:MAG: ABC transporter substrate-binding protein, partial [Alphaproteobacteria bacterium]